MLILVLKNSVFSLIRRISPTKKNLVGTFQARGERNIRSPSPTPRDQCLADMYFCLSLKSVFKTIYYNSILEYSNEDVPQVVDSRQNPVPFS